MKKLLLFLIFTLAGLMRALDTRASIYPREIHCDDGVADGGYSFVISQWNERNMMLDIYRKSRAGTALWQSEVLTRVELKANTVSYRTRMGHRPHVTLVREPLTEGPVSFYPVQIGFYGDGSHRVRIPKEGFLKCMVSETE